MNITLLFTKKILENIIKYSFLNFKHSKVYSFLDTLKSYGFLYSTDAGISISINDLKISRGTNSHLKNLEESTINNTYAWEQGKIDDTERFNSIINSWTEVTENIKDDIINYFQIFEPVNCLFIMANSGARGNMSQVRQLIGVRGLMSDQEGNIIDTPVNACFRDGLSSIDYLISAYGARKGVVDTAVKTASAGYLTRRLIFLARNIIIKHLNCNTKKGILINLSKTKDETLNGYFLVDIFTKKKTTNVNINELNLFKNKIIDSSCLNFLRSKKNLNNVLIKIRSILTCDLPNSICQQCYGIDYSTYNLVSLGEVIGIIAAQSIGEPGTQLTMRTFHTGGVFVTQIIKKEKLFFSGKIFLKNFFIDNSNLKILCGEPKFILYNWKGSFKKLTLENKYFPVFKYSTYLYDTDIFSKATKKYTVIEKKKLKPVILNQDSKIIYQFLKPRNLSKAFKKFTSKAKNNVDRRLKKIRKLFYINFQTGTLRLETGFYYNVKKNINICYPKNIFFIKKLGFSQLILKYSGICICSKSLIKLITFNYKKIFDLKLLVNFFYTDKIKKMYIIPQLQNYKFIDSYSRFLSFLILPNYSININYFEKKIGKFETIIFIFDTYTKFISDIQKNFTEKLQISKDGIKYKKINKVNFLFPKFAIINPFSKDYILKQSILGYILTHAIQGNDIVQGIPKVSQILEGVTPKLSAILSIKPGISVSHYSYIDKFPFKYSPVLNKKQINKKQINKKKLFKENTYIFHTLLKNLPLVIFNKKFWTCEQSIEDYYEIIMNKQIIQKLNFKYINFPEKYNLKSAILEFDISKSIKDLNKNNLRLIKIFSEELFENYIKLYETERAFYLNNVNLSFLMPNKKYYTKANNLLFIVDHFKFGFFGHKNFLSSPLKLYKFLINKENKLKKIFLNIEKNKEKLLTIEKMNLIKNKTLADVFNKILDFCKNSKKILKRRKKRFQLHFMLQQIDFLYLKKIKSKMKKVIKIISYIAKKYKQKFLSYFISSGSLNSKNKFFILKKFPLISSYSIKSPLRKISKEGYYIDLAEPISTGFINPHELLRTLYLYNAKHYINIINALDYSSCKFQLIILNSILSVYQSQEVNILLKHMEIICKQLTNRSLYNKNFETKNLNALLPGEPLVSSLAKLEHKIYLVNNTRYHILIRYYPVFQAAKNVSLSYGFLSSSSFQYTKQTLTKAALLGLKDFCTGIKDQIILGKLMNAGTAFLYKNQNLIDTIQFYKNT